MPIERKLAAIMFTDIAGYTALSAKDENKALELLDTQKQILTPIIEEFNGTLHKEMGDGLLFTFLTVTEAVKCGIKIQEQTKPNDDLNLRVGIHEGEITLKDGDALGDDVNVASRIEAFAPSGGIAISSKVQQNISSLPEFETSYVGKPELKGVAQEVKVYCITSHGLPKSDEIVEPITVFSDLFKRRVPHTLGIYIAGCWTIVQIVGWIISRYLISPHLVDLCLITMVSFIPSVCLISYYHGTSGRDRWQPIERIAIPLNIIVSIIMVVIVFAPKDLGAQTESITLEDENGNVIQKVIPKNEFRKKIATFFFENETGNSTLDWLRYGLPWLCDEDINQDLYLSHITQNYFNNKIDNAGYNRSSKLPLSLKMKIAKSLNNQYFLDGSFNIMDDTFIVISNLYNTKNGSLVAENRFVESNLFTLVDKLVNQLKIDLSIPLQYLETTKDLPVNSITTDNIKALASYIQGELIWSDNNRDSAFTLLTNAIKHDKYFLHAHARLSELKMSALRDESWSDHWEIILKGIDKLSDRTKFSYKRDYYMINGDEESYKKVVTMHVQLYPHDIEAHSSLVEVYRNENNPNRWDNVINEYKIMLDIDPEKYELYKWIGDSYNNKNDFDNAIKYYVKYSKIFVNDPGILSKISYAYWQLGNYEQSISNLEESVLLSNEQHYYKLMLLNHKYYSNKIDENKYINGTNILLEKSENFTDSMRVYLSMKEFYVNLGEIKKSYEYVEKISNMNINRYSIMYEAEHLWEHDQLNIFKHLNMMDSVKIVFDYYEENTVPPYDNMLPYIKCLYYLYSENYEMLVASIDDAALGYAEF